MMTVGMIGDYSSIIFEVHVDAMMMAGMIDDYSSIIFEVHVDAMMTAGMIGNYSCIIFEVHVDAVFAAPWLPLPHDDGKHDLLSEVRFPLTVTASMTFFLRSGFSSW